MFLKNKKNICKIRGSKVADYAALKKRIALTNFKSILSGRSVESGKICLFQNCTCFPPSLLEVKRE